MTVAGASRVPSRIVTALVVDSSVWQDSLFMQSEINDGLRESPAKKSVAIVDIIADEISSHFLDGKKQSSNPVAKPIVDGREQDAPDTLGGSVSTAEACAFCVLQRIRQRPFPEPVCNRSSSFLPFG